MKHVHVHDYVHVHVQAHLVNFGGSDTMPGLCCLVEYYGWPLAMTLGTSIPAAEHSTITSWTKEGGPRMPKSGNSDPRGSHRRGSPRRGSPRLGRRPALRPPTAAEARPLAHGCPLGPRGAPLPHGRGTEAVEWRGRSYGVRSCGRFAPRPPDYSARVRLNLPFDSALLLCPSTLPFDSALLLCPSTALLLTPPFY